MYISLKMYSLYAYIYNVHYVFLKYIFIYYTYFKIYMHILNIFYMYNIRGYVYIYPSCIFCIHTHIAYMCMHLSV